MNEDFELIKHSGAILCKHVAEGSPIQIAKKDEPVCDVDSGWQFLCGCDMEDDSEAQIWKLGEVINLEPSLLPHILSDEDSYLVKDTNSKKWIKMPSRPTSVPIADNDELEAQTEIIKSAP